VLPAPVFLLSALLSNKQPIVRTSGEVSGEETTPAGAMVRSTCVENGRGNDKSVAPLSEAGNVKSIWSSDPQSSMRSGRLSCLAMGIRCPLADPLRFADRFMNAAERLREIDMLTKLRHQFHDDVLLRREARRHLQIVMAGGELPPSPAAERSELQTDP
jgi:hypothetical protein